MTSQERAFQQFAEFAAWVDQPLPDDESSRAQA
jgi:hypothetical protein